MGKRLKWLKVNRIRLLEHFESKKPQWTPPRHWWIVVLVIQQIVESVEQTFIELPGLSTLACEQTKLLTKLVSDIASRTNLLRPMSNDEMDKRQEDLLQSSCHYFSTSSQQSHPMTPQEQRELVQPPDSCDGKTVSMEARS
jgi:hypothetical protein